MQRGRGVSDAGHEQPACTGVVPLLLLAETLAGNSRGEGRR
jgi:hypothetical protein